MSYQASKNITDSRLIEQNISVRRKLHSDAYESCRILETRVVINGPYQCNPEPL